MGRSKKGKGADELGGLAPSVVDVLLNGSSDAVDHALGEMGQAPLFDEAGRGPLLLLVLRGDPTLIDSAIDFGP